MSLRRQCDRCGHLFEKTTLTTLVSVGPKTTTFDETVSIKEGIKDLCVDCAMSFRLWWGKR